MGENGVNIANFTLGRNDRAGEAIAILYADEAVEDTTLQSCATPASSSRSRR